MSVVCLTNMLFLTGDATFLCTLGLSAAVNRSLDTHRCRPPPTFKLATWINMEIRLASLFSCPRGGVDSTLLTRWNVLLPPWSPG